MNLANLQDTKLQKLVVILYTNNELSGREIKKAISLLIALKRIKYLKINLTKEVKDLEKTQKAVRH